MFKRKVKKSTSKIDLLWKKKKKKEKKKERLMNSTDGQIIVKIL